MSPWAAPHPCAWPGCAALLPRGVARCEKHRRKPYIDRPSSQEPGYGSAWRKLRAEILERDGHRCVLCGFTERLQVDHIIARAVGGDDSPENLRVLCSRCNGRLGSRLGGSR